MGRVQAVPHAPWQLSIPPILLFVRGAGAILGGVQIARPQRLLFPATLGGVALVSRVANNAADIGLWQDAARARLAPLNVTYVNEAMLPNATNVASVGFFLWGEGGGGGRAGGQGCVGSHSRCMLPLGLRLKVHPRPQRRPRCCPFDWDPKLCPITPCAFRLTSPVCG
jgi:hypothetical protein